MRSIAGLAALLLVGGTAVWATSRHWSRESCTASGGAWVSANAIVPYCDTAACFDGHSCRPSYRNTAICRELHPGITERELVFRLGEPVRREDRTLFFLPSPTACDDIRARLDHGGRLQTIHCGVQRRSCVPTETALHAEASAWGLMLPPHQQRDGTVDVDKKAPLPRWNIAERYETQRDCLERRKQAMDWAELRAVHDDYNTTTLPLWRSARCVLVL